MCGALRAHLSAIVSAEVVEGKQLRPSRDSRTSPNDRGGIEADLTVNRLDEEKFLVVTAYTTQLKDADWILRHIPEDSKVVVTDVTSGWATLGIFRKS